MRTENSAISTLFSLRPCGRKITLFLIAWELLLSAVKCVAQGGGLALASLNEMADTLVKPENMQ